MIFLQRSNVGASLSYLGDTARILKNGAVVVDWTVGGVINGIPEGDGYTVEIKTGTAIRSDSLAVGVVVWTLGQSNMHGWYQTPALSTPNRGPAYMFDAGKWNPLAGDGAVTFANDISAALGGTPVAFVDGSVNGSALFANDDGGFGYWEAGSASLYTTALQTLKSAGGKAEFVLWNQGEADVGGVTAEQYQAGLTALFSRVQADDPASDILISGLGRVRLPGQEPGFTAIRNGQAATAAAMSHVSYVPTDLDLEFSDAPHYSGASRAWQAHEVAAVAAYLRGAPSPDAVEILGGSGVDVITGTAGNDIIAGYGSIDTLSGGKGDDLIRGGTGSDLVSGEDGNDLLSGGDDADVIYGGAGNDEIYGDGGDDLIYGDGGDDLIFAGEGNDLLYGGTGNDNYIISATTVVVEDVNGGTDTVQINDNYSLGANLENLVLIGSAVSGTGNSLANKITGGTAANQIFGLDGDDALYGMEAGDTLLGGAGNDMLDGGTGSDTLIGGVGNDSYIVDNSGDVVLEDAAAGIDTIKTSLLTYTLSENVENLTFGGSGAFTATANALANVITGGGSGDTLNGAGGSDTLNGLSGNDSLDGGTGDDVMNGGIGNDTYYVDSSADQVSEAGGGGADIVYAIANFVLPTDVETLTLLGPGAISGTGNALTNKITGNDGDNVLLGMDGADTLVGGAGNDYLDGGAGIDSMSGGVGDDTYVVDSSGETITETGGSGTDTVITSLTSYTLSSTLENLTYIGSAAFKGIGNTAANFITGGSGDDNLSGSGGNDVLDGGTGSDAMTGGTDDDIYYVENVGDSVVEYGSGGNDIVRTTLNTYTIPKAVERLEFIGTGAFNATGSSAAETLVGGASNDTLDGSSGNDVLIGGGGNDLLVGGAGTDIAKYLASSNNYRLTKSGTTITLQDLTGATGTDTLSTVETVTFSDGSYSTSVNNAPVAAADAYTVLAGKATTLAVLANDWDLETDIGSLGLTVVANVGHGTVTLSDSVLSYTSAAGYSGTDSFTYKISDGSRSSATVIVTLTVQSGTNTAPKFISPASGAVPENTLAVAQLSASDPDTADALTFSIAGGDDAALFKIVTGNALQFVTAPDYEGGHASTYQLTLNVSDGVHDVLQAFTVTATDANDEAATITSPSSAVVRENAMHVIDLTASDRDTTGEVTTFSIKPNTRDGSMFKITGSSLDFIAAPDFDVANHGPYSVTIVASDGLNTSEQTVTVTVADVNDNAPVITSAASKTVAENTTHVLDLAASDKDMTSEPIMFSIKPGAGDAALFTVAGGSLNFIAPPDFDVAEHGPFSVTVVASDGVNSTEQTISVGLVNTNDTAPVITSATSATVNENQTQVLTLTVTDADGIGESPTFAIKPNSGDGALFAIVDGTLQFLSAPDFESSSRDPYSVTVVASDGVNSVEQTVAVTVTDLNDTGPAITSAAAMSVSENTTHVLVLNASDPDTTGESTTYSIKPNVGDAALFQIGGNSLDFAAAPDFEDLNHAPSYSVTVTASDGANTSEQTISVTISDVHEVSTRPSPITTTITETGTDVINLASSIDGTLPTVTSYTIQTGTGDAALFGIVGSELQFASPVSFNAPHGPTYHLTVVARDLFNTVVQPIVVNVLDINNQAPVITSGISVTAPENQLQALMLTATDPDTTGEETTFAIKPNTADGALFTIADGILRFLLPPDFESTGQGPYNVTVIASDGVNSSEQTINVSVGDVRADDVLYGTASDDSFTVTPAVTYDTVDGLDGSDTLSGAAVAGAASVSAQNNAFVLDLDHSGTSDFFVINTEHLVLSGSSLSFTDTAADTALAYGNAMFNGTVGNDTLDGSLGGVAMILNGGGGIDLLKGGIVGDFLDGGAGNDQMSGGAGNDVYVVDNSGDVVTEAGNAGMDTIRTTLATYTLGSNVESLVSLGSTTFTGMGNALDNVLIGGVGNDRLDGGSGADKLLGGLGDDSYIIDNSGDLVVENAGAGTDSVSTGISYTLGANVEKLTLTGSTKIDGTGNDSDNTINGNSGDNILVGGIGSDSVYGGSGNDTLIGGWGIDYLTGNTGADMFVFDVMETKANKDTIKDFEHGIDHIAFNGAVFVALIKDVGGALNSSQFVVGTAATNANQHLIYNTSASALYYDPDGSGGTQALLIATFSNKATLDLSDFLVI